MAKKFLYVATISALILAISIIIINDFLAADPEILIWNESGRNCELNYFSNNNGKWLGGMEVIQNTSVANAELKKIHLYQAAEFSLTVGNKVGHFYCSANIEADPFRSSIKLSYKQGNCYTLQLNPRQLAIVITKPHNNREKKLLS